MKTVIDDNLIAVWIRWHFLEMPAFLYDIWKNYFLFSIEFFSVKLLLLTLFEPWKRYTWNYPKGFSVFEYVSAFISNLFSRLMGAICRLALVLFSFLVQIFMGMAGTVVIGFWVLMPLILLALLFMVIW